MPEPLKVEAYVVRQLTLWFVPYEPTDPEVITSDYTSERLRISISHNFDYERLAKDDWGLHFDVGLDVLPLARMKVRTVIEIVCPKERLFHTEGLTPLNKIALETAQTAFFEHCKTHGINTPVTKIFDVDERAKEFAPYMIEQFHVRQKNALSYPK